MFSDADGTGRVNCYAVVSYITGPLGRFVDEFRREVSPFCDFQAHITILPPRLLAEVPADALEQLKAESERAGAFEIEATEVGIFDGTQVVYLAVGAGAEELSRFNRILNAGLLGSAELFPYHPHITLAQEIDGARIPQVLELARERWAEFRESRRFELERVKLVQYTRENRWVDLSEYRIGRSS